MSHTARIEDLTAAEADTVADEWRQLGATQIQRIAQADGRFTMTCVFPGSPFATDNLAEVLQPAPVVRAASPMAVRRSTEFELLAPEYRQQFDACVSEPDKEAQIQLHLNKIRPGEMRYRALGERLGIPWAFIAIVHSLECGCDFTRHLHNGDPLSARTVRVPAGRPLAGEPPFTWEASAEDALVMKRLAHQPDWSLAAMLFRWEAYNGFGYRVRGLASPYLWSFSNVYQGGLFVDDHVFDPAARSRQCGAAVLLKRLMLA
jgi:lysozyme family protein